MVVVDGRFVYVYSLREGSRGKEEIFEGREIGSRFYSLRC